MTKTPNDGDAEAAAAIRADDRAEALRWLQDNAEGFLDFDFLEERERSGR